MHLDFHDAVAFPNLAAKAVAMARLDFQQKMKDMFKDERALALKYYRGRAEDDYMSFLTTGLQDQIPTPSNNITKRIVDRTSLVYSEPPIRSLGEDFDMANYNKYTKGIDRKMQIAERRTNLLHLIAIKETWRNDRIERDIILDFEPFFGADPLTPIAIAYPLTQKSTVTDLTPETWIYWDKEGWIKYERGGKVIDMSEPGKPGYNVLPFIFAFEEVPESYFLDVSVDRELIFTNRVINVLTANMGANVIFRSHGQKFATGIHEETNLTGGQDVIITLPEGSTLGSVAPEDTIISVKDAIDALYKWCALNHHLNADFVEGTVLSSGVALAERARELTEDRKSDIPRWRDIEEQAYVIDREILRVEKGLNLPAPENFSINYEEDYIDESTEERRTRWDWELDHHFTTDAIILMEEDPDKFDSIEDAQAFIDDNRVVNVAGSAPVPTLANALVTPVV